MGKSGGRPPGQGMLYGPAQFWRHVRKEGAALCWFWTGPLSSKGMPYTVLNGERQVGARIAWRLEVDPHLEDETVLRRVCTGGRLCVNPAHHRATKRARDLAAEWHNLRLQGHTDQQIAEAYGRIRETVCRAVNEYRRENRLHPFQRRRSRHWAGV